MPSLSEAAKWALLADLAAQRRIDRDKFVEHFREALGTPSCSVIFILPHSSNSDARQLADWSQAQAQSEKECFFGRIDVAPGAPVDLASLVADLLEQWKEHLPRCEAQEALANLRGFVERNSHRKFVLLAAIDSYDRKLLQPVLEVILQRTADQNSRVCVLVSSMGEEPTAIAGVVMHHVDIPGFSTDDLDCYLRCQGYSVKARGDLIGNMKHLDLLSTPARVYTYVDDHCQAWQNLFPETNEVPPQSNI
jgi:hypothetical protein